MMLTNIMSRIALPRDIKWARSMLGKDLACEHLRIESAFHHLLHPRSSALILFSSHTCKKWCMSDAAVKLSPGTGSPSSTYEKPTPAG